MAGSYDITRSIFKGCCGRCESRPFCGSLFIRQNEKETETCQNLQNL